MGEETDTNWSHCLRSLIFGCIELGLGIFALGHTGTHTGCIQLRMGMFALGHTGTHAGCTEVGSRVGLSMARIPFYVICCLEHRAVLCRHSWQTDDAFGAIMMSNFTFKSGPDGRCKSYAAACTLYKLN